jgi:putative ABC transport system permease protein
LSRAGGRRGGAASRGAAWRAFGTAPWRRAPLLLRRQPAVLAAVVFAGLILGAAAAAVPVFESSVASAAIATQIGQRCATTAGYNVTSAGPLTGPIGDDDAAGARGLDGLTLLGRRDAEIHRLGAAVPNLGAPSLTMSGPPVIMRSPTDQSRSANGRLMYRQGFLDHIQKLQAAGGNGVWLPSEAARFAGVRAGGRVDVVFNDRTVSALVAGIYQDLNRLPQTPFWCSQGPLIYQPGFGEEIPPPLILVDRDTLASLDRQLRQDRLNFTWELPLAGDLTLPGARATVAALDDFRAGLGAGPRLFRLTSGTSFVGANSPGVAVVNSELPFITQRSGGIVAAVSGAIGPVATAGIAVALLLVAAAGSYWVDRRRREVALLAAKGVGPVEIALKAALEMLLPAVVGVIAGWGLAVALVRTFGPSDLLDPAAPRAALARAAVALVGGLLLLAVAAALRVRAHTERGLGVRSGRLGRIPFEVAVLALAALAFQRLQSHRPPVATGTSVPRIDLLLLAFPLLFLTGMVGVAVQALGPVTRRLRTAGSHWPHAVYLASRRLASSSRLALLLLAAAAVSIGVLVYAATLTQSVRSTLDAKARVFLGSDVSMLLLDDVAPPPGVRGTTVARLDDGEVGGNRVDLLAIDRSSFEGAAFWDPSFSSRPLRSMLASLGPARAGGAVPVLAQERGVPTDGTIALFLPAQSRTVRIAYHVVDRVRTFPGVRANPLLVMDRRALSAYRVSAEYRLWARGDLGDVQAPAQRAGIATGFASSAADVLDASSFLAISWTFGFLQSFGVLTGLITVGGLLLYLETRQRARKATYVLIRRMGLSRAAHRLSVFTEVGATLVGGCLAGMALSLLAARLVYPRLDALPSVQPPPLLRTPVLALAATGAAVLLAAWLGAWTAQRSADRTNAAEVLRLAE